MTYVFTLSSSQLSQIQDFYGDYQVNPTTPYIKYMYKNSDIVVSVFESLKITLQGSSALEDYMMWSEIFGFETLIDKPVHQEKPVAPSLMYLGESTIGSDEVGTGDFFGPVVVCSAFVRKDQIQDLKSLGVDDSKKLTDDFIQKIAPKIMELITYQLLVLDNPKYNSLVNEGYNQNKIKAYLHNHAILKCKAKVKDPIDRVILDEFCSKKNYYDYLSGRDYYSDITFMQKAESKSISVAIASIIARFRFLEEMDKLSENLGIVLPKGSSVVSDLIGKRIALEKGFDVFNDIAKVHFKNYQKIKEMMK